MLEHHAKILSFELNKQMFAVDTRQVLSIEKIPHVTEVPQTLSFIRGIAEFRGVITPIIDLKSRLQVSGHTESNESRILLVAMDDLQMGLMVDKAKEVKEIDPASIQPMPSYIKGGNKLFLNGLIKERDNMIILLDLLEVLSFEELKEVKKLIAN